MFYFHATWVENVPSILELGLNQPINYVSTDYMRARDILIQKIDEGDTHKKSEIAVLNVTVGRDVVFCEDTDADYGCYCTTQCIPAKYITLDCEDDD